MLILTLDVCLFVSDGTALGGHCKDYSWCFVEHSICNYESYACHCLFGYRESDHNTCERVPGLSGRKKALNHHFINIDQL